MKKTLLFISVLLLVFTLSSCRDNIGKHEKTLSKFDNYVMTLENTKEVDGVLQTSKVYYYVDNTNSKTCITTYNPANLLEQDQSGETPFGCIGVQLEIGGEQYYYDGLKAYIFADSNKTNVQKIFFKYFGVEDYTESNGDKVYSIDLEYGDLEYEMKQIIGASSIDDSSLDSSKIVLTAVYSDSEKRFVEFTVEYEDYLEKVYALLGTQAYIAEAYTTFTYGYFDKKYTIDTRVPLGEIDDYPDSLGTAELVGYTIIEDGGSVEGSFLDEDDSDVFQFNASGPNQYTIGVDVQNNEIVEFIISDFNGALIQYGYFDGVQGYSTIVELISAGTYYIIINPIEGSTVPFDYEVIVE